MKTSPVKGGRRDTIDRQKGGNGEDHADQVPFDILLCSGREPLAETRMKRNLKALLLGGAAAASLVLTCARGGPDGNSRLVAKGAPPRVPRAASGARRSASFENDVFTEVIGRVTEAYVEPERIRPRQMLFAALHAVERNVAEVLVQDGKDDNRVTVRVQDAERRFSVKGVNSVWGLSEKLHEIFEFIKPRLDPDTNLRDVKYAAINGILNTLDPHSLLLNPDVYNEMKLSTRGHFGGLGIVISMVRGALTVMKPMKGTPAADAGLKACDSILKIDQESTVNMTLTQAVRRLRGEPGSKVTITIRRASWPRPRKVVLTRGEIKVDSVSSRMLASNIGYVRLTSFQGNSVDDIREHLGTLKQQGMKGLVLDLRANPGGLLDQAIKVADLFIETGTLVTTVSEAGRKREDKRAARDGTEERYPIAVLVSGSSASASEIVSGALKHLDRAVIIGRRTFGKGTVQVLYDNRDGSALKLTIAQYLTSGQISIQSVGITPDVMTAPVLVRKKFVRLRLDDNSPREKDLRKHLTHRDAKIEKPSRTVRYLATPLKRNRKDAKEEEQENKNLCLYPDRRCKPRDEDRFVLDFQIRLARDLLAQAKGWRRPDILRQSENFFATVQQGEHRRIAKELTKFGVDWSTPSGSTTAASESIAAKQKGEKQSGDKAKAASEQLVVSSVTTDLGGLHAQACKVAHLRVSVRNDGAKPLYQVAAVTESSNRIFDGHELVFGKLAPGQARSWAVPIKVRDVPTRMDEVRLKFRDAHETKLREHAFQLAVDGIKRPVFAYGYQLIDDIQGNLDGQPQRGERVRLLVHVRNTGKGAAFHTVTRLKNLSGIGIFLRKGRFVMGRMEPGESKTASFTFDVEPAYAKKDFKLELTVYDDGLQEGVSEKLSFHLGEQTESPSPAEGRIACQKDNTPFRAWPSPKAPVIGYAGAGQAFTLLGRAGKWYRVQAATGRPAFVLESDVETKPAAGRATDEISAVLQVTPPRIALDLPQLTTDRRTILIRGKATDETKVSDLYIFVRNPEADIEGEKVFYRSNRRSRSPKQLAFKAEVPLWEGANYVTIFARENNDVQSQEVVVVYRKKGGEVAKHLGASAGR